MTTKPAKILCVEWDESVLKSRCAVLKVSGYETTAASPELAETILRSQQFDLIVISGVSDFELHRIVDLANGANVLVLDEIILPAELLSLVAQRLDRQRRA
jgi:hypothetical protein